jgi:hypothetical protein
LHAEYLGEYDAIQMQTSWEGLGIELNQSTFDPAAVLRQRNHELNTFFSNGGICLVELQATPDARNRLSGAPMDIYQWWAQHIPVPYPKDSHSEQPFINITAPGSSVLALVPGHPLEAYLEAHTRYEVRFGTYVAALEPLVVLAENRVGEPVAIEVPVARGAIVAVPVPIDAGHRDQLKAGLIDLLRAQLGYSREWPMQDEEALRHERQRVLGDLADQRRQLDIRSSEIQAAKAKALEEPHVRRTLRYWDRATRPGAPPKTTVDDLYAMIEMLKDYYNSDWDSLGEKIGVSNKSVGRIKTFANRRELHLRHTTADDPQAIDQDELDRVLEDGRKVVATFLEQRYKAHK